MKKLKLLTQISIDGYIAETNGNTNWMVWNWGDEWSWDDALRNYFNDLTASIDCILISRKMAEEGFNAHWAKKAEDPHSPQFQFAKKIHDTPKVVFTKTLEKSEWKNNVLAKGNLVDEVNKFKKEEGKGIIAYGGATFASSLIRAGLVDEFYLFVNPTVLGSGMGIFKDKTNLKLIKSTSYACGIVVLKYEPLKQ